MINYFLFLRLITCIFYIIILHLIVSIDQQNPTS